MVSKSVGCHDAIDELPGWVFDLVKGVDDLWVSGEAPHLGMVRAVVAPELFQVGGEFDVEKFGKRNQGSAANLAATGVEFCALNGGADGFGKAELSVGLGDRLQFIQVRRIGFFPSGFN